MLNEISKIQQQEKGTMKRTIEVVFGVLSCALLILMGCDSLQMSAQNKTLTVAQTQVSPATICVLQPSSGQTSFACQLPAVSPGQCVDYDFMWNFRGGTSSVELQLGGSIIYPNTSLVPDGTFPFNTWELKGKACSTATANEFILNDPLVRDVTLIEAPNGSSVTEDISAGSTLTLTLTGQRGFGVPAFMGGSISVM